jgi:uncharacterized protein YcbK (DUF882 family)
MRLERRDLLLKASAVGAALLLPGAAMAKTPRIETLKPIITPELQLFNANTGERMSSVFYRNGRYIEQELRRIDWMMRDWREKESKPVDRNLLWALAAIREAGIRDGHNGEIRFLSGYRSKKTNDMLRRTGHGAARNSFHIKAEAVDFSLPGIPVKPVSEYARWLELGGVGHYKGSFIHMDTGTIRHWTK